METNMPDRVEKLKAIVGELEAELESLDSLPPEAQRVLEEAVTELNAVLGKSELPATIASQSLVDRLRVAEEDFAVSHPTLAGVVARILHGLGQLGI